MGSEVKKGIPYFSIMLFALVSLTVVLVDGIAISLNGQKRDLSIAKSYCWTEYSKFPRQCKVTQVYKCDDRLILATSCIGVGNAVLDRRGNLLDWCGYTSLGVSFHTCGKTLFNKRGESCLGTKNLCK